MKWLLAFMAVSLGIVVVDRPDPVGATPVAPSSTDGPREARGSSAGAAAGHNGRTQSVTVWVTGVPGGGVGRPAGSSGTTCSGWVYWANLNDSWIHEASRDEFVRVDADGVTAELYRRRCGSREQWVWVRRDPPQVLVAAALRASESVVLAEPVPVFAPPTFAVVNLETWLWVDDPGPVEVSAWMPGLSVTARAVVESTRWVFGDEQVVCEGVGVPWVLGMYHKDDPAPCGFTFRSIPADPVLEVAVTWSVTWAASNGATGTIDPVTSRSAVMEYPVREIQTIGVYG